MYAKSGCNFWIATDTVLLCSNNIYMYLVHWFVLRVPILLVRKHHVVYAACTLCTFSFLHNLDTHESSRNVHCGAAVQMLLLLSTPNTYYNQTVCRLLGAIWRTLYSSRASVACPTVLVCNTLYIWRCHICDTSVAVWVLSQCLPNRCINDATLSITILSLAFALGWKVIWETGGKWITLSYAPREW